ncbi:MAG: NUDIX domain-containing protein [Patescibacteria group bacterium]|jgi:8-oxo-dGTP diphosphatase
MPEENKKPGVGFGVMILRDNKILLGKRHVDPAKASSVLHGEGTWTMPGGKLHFGETFEAGAARELMEETGMEIGTTKVISLTNNIVPDAQFITIGLLSEDTLGEPQVMEPDEITEWRWFSLEELPSPIYLASQQVLDNYLAKKFY